MPDIMMCAADNCPLSQQCYRHADSGTKPDPYRQTYWARGDDAPVGDGCEVFWKRTSLVAMAHDGSMP